VPHDYNWYIREMKSEIDPRHRPAQSPQTPPPKPRRSEETTGKFTVEEIKTAKIAIPDAKKTAAEQLFEKLVSEGTRDGVSEETSAGLEELAQKLSLAERLMIKELARLLAEKITEQIPREALLRMLAEALADLKKH